MLNKIEFNYFDDNKEIYFNTGRLRKLKTLTKLNIEELIKTGLDLEIMVRMLQVGLEHEYGNVPAEFYDKKLDKYLEEGGTGYSKIWETVLKAVLVSGMFGKEVADKVMAERYKEIEYMGKNV